MRVDVPLSSLPGFQMTGTVGAMCVGVRFKNSSVTGPLQNTLVPQSSDNTRFSRLLRLKMFSSSLGNQAKQS